jgi:hypothetical protein
MICIEVGSSIPYLDFHWDLSSSVERLINEAGFCQGKEFFLFSLQKCALFHFFPFLIRWVSLKEREFTYSKFQQNINITTHQILGLGGSSIP